MRVKIQKWGNSLALRIPKAFAVQTKMRQDSTVSLSVKEDSVIVTPVEENKFTLKRLLSDITKSNLHREVKTGKSVGRETW